MKSTARIYGVRDIYLELAMKSGQTGVCFALVHPSTTPVLMWSTSLLAANFGQAEKLFILSLPIKCGILGWALEIYYNVVAVAIAVGRLHSIFMHSHEMCRVALNRRINHMNKWYNNFIKRKYTNESKHIEKSVFMPKRKIAWANEREYAFDEWNQPTTTKTHTHTLDFEWRTRASTEEWRTQPNRSNIQFCQPINNIILYIDMVCGGLACL